MLGTNPNSGKKPFQLNNKCALVGARNLKPFFSVMFMWIHAEAVLENTGAAGQLPPKNENVKMDYDWFLP